MAATDDEIVDKAEELSFQQTQAGLVTLINSLNLTLATSIPTKEYQVQTIGAAPKVISMPFGLTLAEYEEQLRQKLQAMYFAEIPYLVATDDYFNPPTMDDLERFGLELDLKTSKLKIYYFNVFNCRDSLEEVSATFDLTADHAKVGEFVKKIEDERIWFMQQTRR